MTIIADSITSSSRFASAPRVHAGARAVSIWLFVVAAFVFAMVLVGGATRLTGSGLSITEWQPILGVIPPTTDAAWQDAFDKYKQIPEYQLVNPGMSLDAFKTLYWWEWGHRLLGRLIGFVFFIPFAWFLVRRSIPKGFVTKVATLFMLGGAQGALGWFMVQSGLSQRVDVSQYRLAAHLGLAVLIAGYAFWLALSIGKAPSVATTRDRRLPRVWARATGALAGLIYLQVLMGGLVAGLKAGHASNTWPLMNGAVVPTGLDVFSPWYMNLFENPLTAQFAHRLVAYVVALFAAVLTALIWREPRAVAMRAPAAMLCIGVAAQIGLGVATIVYDVPLSFALAHQANAILVLALALWTFRRAFTVGGGETALMA